MNRTLEDSEGRRGRRPDGRRSPGRRPEAEGGDAEEWVPLPPETNGGRKVLAIVGLVVLVVALLIGAVLLWAARKIDPPGEQGPVVEEVVVPLGSSADSIAALLVEEGIITDARLFTAWVGMRGEGPWEAGRYTEFRLNSSFDQAISVLDGGPLPVGSVTVRVTEGRRLSDALAQVAEQHPNVTVDDLVAALASGEVTNKYLPEGVTNFEGMLFPDTYEFLEDSSAVDLLQALSTQMEGVMDSLGYDRATTLQGLSPYEVVVVASLAERETGAPPEERGQIARVVYNRLDAGEPLGIDAAVLYGLGRDAGELTRSDLDQDTPYNTRLRQGLPPTPIGLPSRAALEGAIDPPEGSWRYYVLTSNDPPSHFFTDSYSEFQRAKADAQSRGVF